MRRHVALTLMTAILMAALLVTTGPASADITQPLATTNAAAVQPLDRSFTWYTGMGFDACSAPSLSSMQAWLGSPYRSIAIYIGGAGRACGQPNLTASWVRSIAGMGWKATPIYEAQQAPCYAGTSKKPLMTVGQEATQGRDAALDAVAQATALGIGSGSDIYYDMESYARGSSCSGSVLKFLSAWTTTLRSSGYSSGVYSSLSTGIADVATPAAMPGFVGPDKIWIANWDGKQGVYGYAPYVADSQWSPNRRIHQYRGQGGHSETYGGVPIIIDNDYLDTYPHVGSPFGMIDALTTSPGKVSAAGWAIDPDTSAAIIVQMYIDGRANALTWANLSRPDVGAAYPWDGPNHGYNLTMVTTPGPHTVCLYGINTGPGASTQLGCRAVTVPNSNPFGMIDALTTSPGKVSAAGWAIDPDTSAPIIVQMYIDGRANALTWANLSRPDVGAAYPLYGPNHGYSLTMATTPGRHTVCLYGINTGPGASTQLGCRAVTAP